MRARQAHGRVEVVGAGGEGTVEDRHVEARVHDVEDMRDAVGPACFSHSSLVRGIECDTAESLIGDPIGEAARTGLVVVGADPCLKEVAACSDERG